MKKNYSFVLLLSFLVIMPGSLIRAQSEKTYPSEVKTPVFYRLTEELRNITPVPPGVRDRSWKENVIVNKKDFLEEFSRPSTHHGPDPVLQDEVISSRADASPSKIPWV